jgi:hypothetical protein
MRYQARKVNGTLAFENFTILQERLRERDHGGASRDEAGKRRRDDRRRRLPSCGALRHEPVQVAPERASGRNH